MHGEEVGVYLEGELEGELEAKLEAAIKAMLPDQRPKVLLHGSAPIPRTHTGKIQRRKLVPLFARYDECRGALRIEPAARGVPAVT